MKNNVVYFPSTHHPPLFQKLLDECHQRVARISQVDQWLLKNKEHFDWFETTWSLSEHEEGSEEFAFVTIYKALEESKKLHETQVKIKTILETCPPDDSSFEFRKWARSHEVFYETHVQRILTKYQSYTEPMAPGPKHLTVPMHCYRCTEIYLHKDDFTLAFTFADIMEKYLTSDAYVPPLKFYEKVDIDPELWEDETFLREFNQERTQRSIFDEEEEEEDFEGDLIFSRDYSIPDSIQEALSFHETMVDVGQIHEWIKKSENIFYSIMDDHDKYCGCSYCDPFYDLYFPLYQLGNLINKRVEFRKFEDDYQRLKMDPNQLADFFRQKSLFIWSTYPPSGLTRVRKGLYCYEHPYHFYYTLRFIYQSDDMEDIFDRMDDYREILRGMENYLLHIYNRENKTYYRHYRQYQIESYFKERYAEVAAGYFTRQGFK